MVISFSAQQRGWLHHVEKKKKETWMLFNVSDFSYQRTSYPYELVKLIQTYLEQDQPNFSKQAPTGSAKFQNFFIGPNRWQQISSCPGWFRFWTQKILYHPKSGQRGGERKDRGKGRGQRLNFTNWLVDPTDWHCVTLDPITDSESYPTKLANNNTLVKNRTNQFINNQVKTMGIANPRIIQQQISRN